MSSSRVMLAVGAISLLAVAPAVAQPPWAGGGGGGGGGFRMRMDPNQMFDRFANGKETISRSELSDPNAVMWFDRMAERMGVTNGQISREQFVTFMNQRMAQWGGRGGGRGGPGGGPAGGGGGAGAGGAGGDGQQWTAWAENVFQRLDQNGDGLLNSDEMPEELRAEREKWDANHDGFIDLTEFKAYFQARMQQRMADRGAAGFGPGGQANDPLVIVAPAEPEEEKRPVVYRAGKLPAGMPAWFAQLDTDGDGQVGLYEWKASGRSIEEFQKIDRNGDGFLTPEEVMRYAAASRGSANGAVAAGPGGPTGNGFGPAGFAGPGGRRWGNGNGGRRRGDWNPQGR